jgi:RNA polymerase nonessential primary-like sigma factor
MKNYGDDIGEWMKAAGSLPLLSKEETLELASQIQSLPVDSPKRRKLVNKLASHNLRLAVPIVKKFLSKGAAHRGWGSHDTVDFLQQAALGIHRAAELYDPARGYTFATYASHWVRAKITRYAAKTRSVVHVSESMYRNVVSYKQNGFLKSRRTGKKIDPEKARQMIEEAANGLKCMSLDMPQKTSHGSSQVGRTLADLVPSNSRNVAEDDVTELVDKALADAGISPIEAQALMLVHGHSRSREYTAGRLGVSLEELRGMIRRATALARESEELAALLC